MEVVDWWRQAIREVRRECKKEVNSLISVGAWLIWKKR
jgi:hypothetical protein